MKIKNLVLVALMLMFFLGGVSWSQTKITENVLKLDKGSSVGKAKIADLAWLAGFWEGTGLGGEVDETWTTPKHGHMSGTFRVFKEEKLVFSEYFTLSESGDSISLRLRHFNPDLVGWEKKEEPIEFRLIKIAGKTAWFDGWTYRLDEEGRLSAMVVMKKKDGSVSELAFVMKKKITE